MVLKLLRAWKPYARWSYGRLLKQLDKHNAPPYSRLVAMSTFARTLSLDKYGVRVNSKVKLTTRFKNVLELREFSKQATILISEDLEGIELINGYRNEVVNTTLNNWFINTDGYRIDEFDGYHAFFESCEAIIKSLNKHKNNTDTFNYQCVLSKFLLKEMTKLLDKMISLQIGNQTP